MFAEDNCPTELLFAYSGSLSISIPGLTAETEDKVEGGQPEGLSDASFSWLR